VSSRHTHTPLPLLVYKYDRAKANTLMYKRIERENKKRKRDSRMIDCSKVKVCVEFLRLFSFLGFQSWNMMMNWSRYSFSFSFFQPPSILIPSLIISFWLGWLQSVWERIISSGIFNLLFH
jgi:hypothetical protein